MRKHVIIMIIVVFGLVITSGIIHVMAAQSQQVSTSMSAPLINSIRKQSYQPGCDKSVLDEPGLLPNCRIRFDWSLNSSQQERPIISDSQEPIESQQEILWNDVHRRPTARNISNPNSSNLSVLVLDATGLPTPNAYVRVYTTNGNYVTYTYTDVDGYAFFSLPDGTYFIKTSSYDHHFLLYQKNVEVPGTVTLSAVGSSTVTLLATKLDGTPLSTNSGVQVGLSKNDWWMNGDVGSLDSNGMLVFNIIAGTYDVSISDWDNYYSLYTLAQDFSQPNNSVNFDMSVMPSATIIVNNSTGTIANMGVHYSQGNFGYGPGWMDIPAGIHLIVSPNLRYYIHQSISIDDNTGMHWMYDFNPQRISSSYSPGEVFNFNAGGNIKVYGRTQDVTVGESITLTTSPVGDFGGYLTAIYTYTEQFGSRWYIDPQIELTDPNGELTNTDYWWYYFPITSPTGIYTLDFDWNTGPYQGVLTADSQFEVIAATGLIVYVENANGGPAYPAWVYATDHVNYYGWSETGPDGYALLDIPPGTYDVSVESYIEQLFLYETNVDATGLITMTAVGTPVVTLTAKKLDASPMYNAAVFVEPVGIEIFNGGVGYLGASGDLTFHVTPGFYNVDVVDWTNLYYIYDLDLDLTNPFSALNYDMSVRPSAEILFSHPNDALADGIVFRPTTYGHTGFGFSNLPENSPVILLADRYFYFAQDVTREETPGLYWDYSFIYDYLNDTYLNPGDSISFSVGGLLSTAGRTDEAHVGEWITLTDYIRDSFGSYLTGIYTYTDYQSTPVMPRITLTGPDGFIDYANYWWYEMPTTAPTGQYDVHFEWDTGEPYQGLLTADSQFEVKPQQTTAVIPTGGGTLYSPWDDTLYEFAPGTFSGDVIITHTVKYTGIPPYAPWVGIGHFYDVTAVYSETGLPAIPTQPYTITIGYSDWQKGSAIEDSLGLYNWDGGQWALEPTSVVDPNLNQLTAHPVHFSTWGILGDTNRIFLPLTTRP